MKIMGDLDDEYDDFGGFEEDDEDENYNKYFGSDLEDTNDDEGFFIEVLLIIKVLNGT